MPAIGDDVSTDRGHGRSRAWPAPTRLWFGFYLIFRTACVLK